MKENKGGFAFLGKDLRWMIVLLLVLVMITITDKVINYQYLIAQKAVQAGQVTENWHYYLGMAFASIIISVVIEIFVVFLQLWLEKVQKFNFFRRYDGIIQQEGKLQICSLQMEYAKSKVNAIVESSTAVISIIYTISIMGIVEMTIPQYIGAGLILCFGTAFGVWRGRLQQDADSVSSTIGATQQLLSNFFMISHNVLEQRLEEISKKYWQRIRIQCLKHAIKSLPNILKILCFIAFLWTVTETMQEGKVYSYSYIVFSVYGYIVTVANDIGNIVESLSKIVRYHNSHELNNLLQEEKNNDSLVTIQNDNISTTNDIIISVDFSANVIRTDSSEAWYQVPQELHISKGQCILLEGENGTGKSRFNGLLKQIVEGTISYDTKTSIVPMYAENFIFESQNIDFRLIKYLANGVGLKRIPASKEDFLKMKLNKAVNGADRQLLIAVQILYFAIKEHKGKPEKTQLIILDEILGNVSEQNAPVVLEFMVQELKKINACIIVVTHSHKETARKCADQIWRMRNDDERIVIEKM